MKIEFRKCIVTDCEAMIEYDVELGMGTQCLMCSHHFNLLPIELCYELYDGNGLSRALDAIKIKERLKFHDRDSMFLADKKLENPVPITDTELMMVLNARLGEKEKEFLRASWSYQKYGVEI